MYIVQYWKSSHCVSINILSQGGSTHPLWNIQLKAINPHKHIRKLELLIKRCRMRNKTISSILLLLVPSIAVSTPEVAPTWEQLPYLTSSSKYDSDIVWLNHWQGLIRETLIRCVKSPSSGYGFNKGTSDLGFKSASSGRFNLGYPSQGYISGQGYNPGHDNNDGRKKISQLCSVHCKQSHG